MQLYVFVDGIRLSKVDIRVHAQTINTRVNGITALYSAAYHGHWGVANLLLDAGGDPNIVCKDILNVKPESMVVSSLSESI